MMKESDKNANFSHLPYHFAEFQIVYFRNSPFAISHSIPIKNCSLIMSDFYSPILK